MDFPRLKSSMSLNANEQPSIFMALCMVESLFKDVEDSVGGDLSSAQIGDDTLPTKLIWLGRKLQKIYNANEAEFSRNRARLEAMLEQMRAGESAVSEAAAVAERLADLQEREKTLYSDLTAAQKNKEDCEALQEQIASMEQELAALNAFDVQAAQNKYDALQREIASLDAAHKRQQEELRRLERDRAALEQTSAETAQQLAEAGAELRQLQAGEAEKTADLEALKEQIRREKDGTADAKQAKEKLIAEYGYYTDQRQQIEREVDAFRAEKLQPMEASVASAKQDLEACRREKEQQQHELEACGEEREKIILSLAVLMPQLDRAKKALEEKSAEYEALMQQNSEVEEKKKAAEAAIRQVTDNLGTMQDEIRVLEQETLPAAQAHAQEAVSRLRTLQDENAGYAAQTDDLTQKCLALTEQQDALQKTLAAKNAEYTELTAHYSEQSKELSRLQQQLDALRGKSDREKLRRYKEQLNAEMEELNRLAEDCEATEQEIRDANARLTEQKQELEALQQNKQALSEAQQKNAQMIDALAPYAAQENLRRTKLLQTKLLRMERAAGQLTDARRLLVNSLRDPGLSNAPTLAEQLQMAQQSLSRMQKALIECADSMKLEVQ